MCYLHIKTARNGYEDYHPYLQVVMMGSDELCAQPTKVHSETWLRRALEGSKSFDTRADQREYALHCQ